MRTLLTLVLLVAACGETRTDESSSQIRAFAGPITPTTSPPTLAGLTAAAPGTENGNIILWNGSSWVLSRAYSDPTQREGWVDDFNIVGTSCATVGNVGGMVGALSGAGTGCTLTTINGDSWVQLATGSTATGGVRFGSSSTAIGFGTSTGPQCAQFLFRAATLSTGAEEFSVRLGFGTFTTIGVNPADGVFMVYDRATSGDFITWRTCANSVCSAVQVLDGTGGTTSQPMVAGTKYTVKLCVASDGTSSTIAVNGTTSGTISTNIPLEASGRRVGIGGTLIKSVGTTGRIVDLSYMSYDRPFSAAR